LEAKVKIADKNPGAKTRINAVRYLLVRKLDDFKGLRNRQSGRVQFVIGIHYAQGT
jgi:hypothetical protein